MHNADVGRWSIADLSRLGVLKHAQKQLARDPVHRFALVSSDGAPHLEDLVERTARCNGDPALFAKHLTATSEPLRESFETLCKYLGWDPDQAPDQAAALDYLSRVERLPFPRGRQARVAVERLARRLVRGDAASVVSDLETLLITRGMGNELFATDVRQVLKERGHQVLDLTGDTDLHAGVERLQRRFTKTVGSMLIQRSLIKRAESQTLIDAVTRADEPARIAFVHGRAGVGKSGVLFEVAETLASRGVPHLFLRLDHQTPRVSTDRFGQEKLGLPSSPVTCLASVAGGRPAVLVLDQVDAIRWTSSHTADAWDVCEELIEEALATPNVRVVLACRTFDLKDDPRIAAWNDREGTFTLEVQLLAEDDVRRVVESVGRSWEELTEPQRQLLRTPQSLYLWTTIVREGADTTTVTRITELLRAFWKNRRARLNEMGVSAEAQNKLLEAVIQFMDRSGELSAPLSVVDSFPKEADAFKTLDLLRDDGHRVAFSHQSHLDYLIAESLLQRSLARPGSVREWLVAREQSLFRRPRLQQLLTLLREDDPRTFVAVARELIDESNVRFHFKVLTLRVLGSVRQPSRQEVNLVLDLLRRPDWLEQITELVVARNIDWVAALDQAGVLVAWIRSGPDPLRNRAAWLLRTVNKQAADLIWSVAEGLDADLRAAWLPSVLPYDGLSDTTALFNLRIELVRARALGVDLISWDELGNQNPERALRLLHAYLDALFQAELSVEAARRQRQILTRGDAEHARLMTAARRAPSVALDLLWPVCESLAGRARRRWSEERTDVERAMDHLADDAVDILQPILESAAEALAADRPDDFLEFAAAHEACPHESLQRAIVSAFASLPTAYADRALAWLLEVAERLQLKADGDQPPPACKVLERHAAPCSPAVFQRVEEAILAYVDPGERQSFEFVLRHHYSEPNEFGRRQFVLLRSLPAARLSVRAQGRLRVWESKFLDVSPPPATPPLRGGSIVSPIPHDRVLRVSDDEWLSIMQRDWSRTDWRQLDEGRAAHASVRKFAADLMDAANLYPDRFARLALRIPPTAPREYLRAILDGLGRRNPPDRLGQEGRQSWTPCTHALLEELLLHIGYTEDRRTGAAFVTIVESFPTLQWSPEILALIGRYAREHPLPIAGQEPADAFPTAGSTWQSLSALEVRGRAASAIRRLLLHNHERRHALGAAIDALLSDDSVLVRIEALGICAVLLRADRDDAIRRFLVACDTRDDRVLLPQPFFNHFLSDAADRRWQVLLALIRRMVASQIEDVAENGAAWAIIAWLHTGELEDLVAACARGTVVQRRGQADALASEVGRDSPDARAIERLVPYFDDEDASVRSAASSVFWSRDDVFGLAHIPALAGRFVQSAAFRDRAAQFIHELKDHVGPIMRFAEVVLEACRAFAGPLAEPSRDIRTAVGGATRDLVTLLLRVYEQCNDRQRPDLAEACLDVVDTMLRNRVGLMASAVDDLDAV